MKKITRHLQHGLALASLCLPLTVLAQAFPS